ncbi:RNA polymerase sigma factor [Bacillus pinisoli]|uniref:RNA polymerase sigma factor n=1 Tax=Bacillus pinisoli TaxID=2901866 RepID=UPI001FF49003|nr:sigma-70 family RNA polymerase sigma factor [Bacillus pinisoli]
MVELDDKDLYVRVLRQEKSALEQLYIRYEKLIYSFSYRMMQDTGLAEEVTQEVFIKLWRGLGQYDESKGKFSSWLLTMTRNTAIDLLRKRKRENVVELEDRDALQSPEESVEDLVEWKEKGEDIRAAVNTLKEDQQVIINLFYFKGYTQQKISDLCNIPLGTVKGRLRLALKHIRTYLEKERGEYHDKAKQL